MHVCMYVSMYADVCRESGLDEPDLSPSTLPSLSVP